MIYQYPEALACAVNKFLQKKERVNLCPKVDSRNQIK